MASKASPEVTQIPGPFTMDQVESFTQKVTGTVGAPYNRPTTLRPGQTIIEMGHSSEFPQGGNTPSAPDWAPQNTNESKAIQGSTIAADGAEKNPLNPSDYPSLAVLLTTLKARRHRTFARGAYSLEGGKATLVGFDAEVTSTDLLLKDKSVLQIGGLKDKATSEVHLDPAYPPVFKMTNSWIFGGGRYLGEAEAKHMVPFPKTYFGQAGLLAAGWLGGGIGQWCTPPNYASVSCLMIPPTDKDDGLLVMMTTYNPLATHYFAFGWATVPRATRFLVIKPSTTTSPRDAFNLKTDINAFRISRQDPTNPTSIAPEDAFAIANKTYPKCEDYLKAIHNPAEPTKAMDHYLENFNDT